MSFSTHNDKVQNNWTQSRKPESSMKNRLRFSHGNRQREIRRSSACGQRNGWRNLEKSKPGLSSATFQLSKKNTPELARRGGLNQVKLREEVARRHRVGQVASRRGAHRIATVAAARRTAGNGVRRIQLDVGAQVGRIVDRVVGLQVLFQREPVWPPRQSGGGC